MRRKICQTLYVCLALILLCLGPNQSSAATGKDLAEAFDNYFIPVFPAAYGEIINALPADEVANISTVLRGVEFFGYLKSMGDIANSIDSGNNKEAAIESASTLVKAAMSYAQWQGVKSIAIAGSSVGMLPLTALVTAIDITRSSYKAVAASTIAVKLEQLYGSVEFDRELKDTNRKLGEGDPIKINQQTIDRLWRKVIYDPAWADLFKTYVVSELGAEWPEPSIWDRLTVPSNVLREAMLFEEQKRLKSHIATLLIELNKVAQKREAEVVLAKQLRELSAIAMAIDPGQMKEALIKYHDALSRLPQISQYADDLPQKVTQYESRAEKANTLPLAEYLKQYGKQPSVALSELRYEILQESRQIIDHAQILRYIPEIDKKAGSDRQRILTVFKENYLKLWPMRDSISSGIINTKLLNETQAIGVDHTEFIFTRYMPEKFFDNYAGSLKTPVMEGRPQAAALVSSAKGAVHQDKKKNADLYEADLKANNELFKTKNNEIHEQLEKLKEQLGSTSDPEQVERLKQAIRNLQTQKIQMKQRWDRYYTVHTLNTRIDREHFDEILREIEQFVLSNSNKYGTVWASISRHYADAASKSSDFWQSHGNSARNTMAFLSSEELARLERVIRDNPGGYLGIAEDFLLRHMPETPDPVSRAVALNRTMDAMQAEVFRQMGIIQASRMEYYESWQTYTLPSLQYMKSQEAANKISNIETAIATAISFFRSVSPDNIQKSNQAVFKERLETLVQLKDSYNGLKRAASRASGLAGPFETYLKKAKANNDVIEEDQRFLSALYPDFNATAAQITSTLGYFLHGSNNRSFLADESLSVQPEILPSTRFAEILDHRGVLDYSRKSGLGLETLLEEAYAEMPTSSGLQSVTVKTFNDLETKVATFPTADYASFYEEMKKILDESQMNQIIIRFIPREDFQAKFAFDALLGAAAKKLAKTLGDARAVVQKNEAAASAVAQGFNSILGKVNNAINMAQRAIASQEYATAAGLQHYWNMTWGEYSALGGKRQDVDEAFVRLQKLIDEGKQKMAPPIPMAMDQGITEEQTRGLYQEFVTAYGRGDIRRLVRLLANDWQGGDGSDIRDVEEYLVNSFRVFERIQYRISSFDARPTGKNTFQVSYTARITGENRRQRLVHEENIQIIEEVGLVEDSPKILRTLSGSQWLK